MHGSFPVDFLPELKGALLPAYHDKLQLLHDEYSRYPADAWGSITEADLQWMSSVRQQRSVPTCLSSSRSVLLRVNMKSLILLQVVLSRTCSLQHEDFWGSDTSWLVPLFDMLNHAGKQTAFLPGDASEPMNNVRSAASAL